MLLQLSSDLSPEGEGSSPKIDIFERIDNRHPILKGLSGDPRAIKNDQGAGVQLDPEHYEKPRIHILDSETTRVNA